MYNPLSNYYADFWPFSWESGLHLPATARKRPFSRARLDILPMHHRESGHVSALVNLCLVAVSVPINEIDALQLGAGLNLLVNPADVGSPGAFESARPCLRVPWPAPAGLRPLACTPLACFRTRRLAPAGAFAPPGQRPRLRARRPAPPGPRPFRLFRFPANLRQAPA